MYIIEPKADNTKVFDDIQARTPDDIPNRACAFGLDKKIRESNKLAYFLVGVTGLEPAASWSRTKRATKLRYTPSLYFCNAILYPFSRFGKCFAILLSFLWYHT